MIGPHHKLEAGLALSRAFMQKYGYTSLPRQVIALWCGVSSEAIRQIEERALKKLRRYGVFTAEDLNFIVSMSKYPCWRESA